MNTTETGAYQEMAAAIRAVVTGSDVQTLLGYTPELRYVDVTYPGVPPTDKVWLRFSIIQGGEKKRTLGQPPLKTLQGVADLQLFVPAKLSKAAETGRKLADLLRGAFARATASVDFYSVSIKDMPKEEAWFYKRINATYNFDTRV